MEALGWPATLDAWPLLAGLGLFLLGMDQLERAVHAVAGDVFRRMLRAATGHPLRSILLGIVATGLLQSSSILGLMVLAFVGAGILPMRNALGVIMGSNIGSTFTGWIVGGIGFSLDLEALALPFIAFGALGAVFARAESRLNAWGSLALALGLLLLGMQYMVGAADAFARGFDPASLAGHHPAVFFLVGMVVTVIVRTSAATIMMALSAMSVGLLSFEQAAAIAIGADLGTTSTMAIAAVKGVSAKKQVALFHVLFNTVSNTLAFFLLLPHARTITGWYGITDPLLALPAFHTTFNVIGVLLFYPVVGRMGDFLDRRFRAAETGVATFLPRVPVAEKEAAFTALENEIRLLFRRVMALNLRALKIEVPALSAAEPAAPWEALLSPRPTYPEDYEQVKALEGEVLDYVRRLQAQRLDEAQSARLALLLVAAREGVQSAKYLKDMREDLVEFRHSPDAWLQGWVDAHLAFQRRFYGDLAEMLLKPHHEAMIRDIVERLQQDDRTQYELLKRQVYAAEARSGLGGATLPTVLNVVHEVHGSNRALLRAARAVLLDEMAA